MDWLKRMNSVLDYIEDNLDGEIDDNKIAALSASSKGMFQRIFAIITDMTLSEYIRKRRLTQAAADIKSATGKIIDVGVKYNYNSASAFSTAFKNFHGVAPSLAKMPDVQLQSFQRFTFTLVLSVNQGGNSMQYRSIDVKNAEDILQKMVATDNSIKSLNSVSEHNGAKCACDGYRVAVILPEGAPDWDFRDAYFTDEDNKPTPLINRVFTERNDQSFSFQITKKQAEGLVKHFKEDKEDKEDSNPEFIHLNVSAMEVIDSETAMELAANDNERIIAFNIKYLREALNFILCSDDECIELYFNGSHGAFLMKSARLYAAVLPVRISTCV